MTEELAPPPNLAEMEDVDAILGHNVSGEDAARLPAILTKLSALFRAESGQLFTPGASVVRRKVNGNEIWLPQYPATKVNAVTTLSGHPVRFTHVGQWIHLHDHYDSSTLLVVDYEHGSTQVPPLVSATIADAARQILAIDPAAVSGRTQEQETTGPFAASTSYATWAQGGATRLSPEDRAIARSFRRRYGNVWVA